MPRDMLRGNADGIVRLIRFTLYIVTVCDLYFHIYTYWIWIYEYEYIEIYINI
jgi:hypothetical protein